MTTCYEISKHRFLCIFVISLLSLLISYLIEFTGIPACQLCKIQRIIFAALSIFSCAGFFLQTKNILTIILSFVSFTGFLWAIYHLGVQFGYFHDSCAVLNPINRDSFRLAIFQTPLPCSDIKIQFLKVPLSGWAAALFGLCFGISFQSIFTQKFLNVYQLKKLIEMVKTKCSLKNLLS